MKVMFNNLTGLKEKDTPCKYCVFNHTPFCEAIECTNPLFIDCVRYAFIGTSDQIFKL